MKSLDDHIDIKCLKDVIDFVIDRHPIIDIDDFKRVYGRVTKIHGSGKNIHGLDYSSFMIMKYQETKERLQRLYLARGGKDVI